MTPRTCLTLSLWLCLALPARAAGPPAAIQRAAELHAGDVAGVLGFEARGDMAIEAPMMNRKSVWRTWVVTDGGESVSSKVLSLTIDGRPATAKERQAHEARLNDPKARGKRLFDMPYDKRFVGAYTYASGPDAHTFTFRATVRDARHGDGTLWLSPEGRMKRVTLTPCQLPAQVSSATLTIEAAVLPSHGWGVTGFSTTYAGGFGPLKGSMTLSQVQTGHKRFATVRAAEAAAPL